MAQDALASATGRRKESTAHVKLLPGDGKITVNGKTAIEYLKRDVLVMAVEQPLQVTETIGTYDIVASTKGGGLSGQAGAIRLGVARSLLAANEAYRQSLRDFGLLTRDPREVERKKPGRPGARRRFQFSKR
ncbi:TPA: 30S ribosomal protein S9 [Candidatus Latescibacteria bacterium]|nr:30S ribosomal protein S9 [Rhodospirillaceae bacterium]HAA77136.1 30S ribosomal protein S9 [Candidatus Latescibacterota bacterium]